MTPGPRPIIVNPDGPRDAGDGFADVYWKARGAVEKAVTALKGCASCAGTDNAGKKWSDDYDPAAADAVEALGALVESCGIMHDLLHATAANHANANSQSAPEPNPNDLMFPPGSMPIYAPDDLPAFFGSSSSDPSLWEVVKGWVEGELWPNGDPDKLRTAALAWTALADELGLAETGVPAARFMIEQQQSPEVDQILTQVDAVKTAFDEIEAQCRVLSAACSAYADQVEHAHREIFAMLIELGAWVALDQMAGVLAAPFTGGGSSAAAQAGMAGLLAVYGARIAARCRVLTATAEATGLPVIAASGAFARCSESLLPLLTSDVLLYGADGTLFGAGAHWTMALASRRPRWWPETIAKVESQATKTPDGKYYIVAPEPDVRVPVNKSYADKPEILALPKDAKGQYYVDAANKVRYPVNPKWEIGHSYGNEHRRLLADAQARGLTQQQFDVEVNTQTNRLFIEDLPGNRSHRREMK